MGNGEFIDLRLKINYNLNLRFRTSRVGKFWEEL